EPRVDDIASPAKSGMKTMVEAHLNATTSPFAGFHYGQKFLDTPRRGFFHENVFAGFHWIGRYHEGVPIGQRCHSLLADSTTADDRKLHSDPIDSTDPPFLHKDA